MKVTNDHYLLIVLLMFLTYILNVNCKQYYLHYLTSSLIILIVTYVSFTVSAKPNQWLLILRNHKVCKSGIGIDFFMLPLISSYKVIKFKNTLQHVKIQTIGQSLQRQRIKFQAHAFYTVHRQQPYQFYLKKQSNSQALKFIIERALRNYTTKNQINDIFHQQIGHLIKNQTRDQLKKNGIFIQTLSIVSIMLTNQKVFKDLQAQYRLQLQQWADKKQAYAKYQYQKCQLDSDMRIQVQKNFFKNKIQLLQAQSKLQNQIQEKQYNQQKQALQIKRINLQKQSQIYKVISRRLISKLKIQHEQRKKQHLKKL